MSCSILFCAITTLIFFCFFTLASHSFHDLFRSPSLSSQQSIPLPSITLSLSILSLSPSYWFKSPCPIYCFLYSEYTSLKCTKRLHSISNNIERVFQVHPLNMDSYPHEKFNVRWNLMKNIKNSLRDVGEAHCRASVLPWCKYIYDYAHGRMKM